MREVSLENIKLEFHTVRSTFYNSLNYNVVLVEHRGSQNFHKILIDISMLGGKIKGRIIFGDICDILR